MHQQRVRDYSSFSSAVKSRFRPAAEELGFEQLSGVLYAKEREGWYEMFGLQSLRIPDSDYERGILADLPRSPSLTTGFREEVTRSARILGEKYISGKSAIAVARYGKGEIVLFAFRPQHRGQSYATFPFIFNALEKRDLVP